MLLKNLFKYIFNLPFPCGHTVKEVKQFLRENTHCGKYWNTEPKFWPGGGIVDIYMDGNEYVSYNLYTSEIRRVNLDY